MRPEEFFKTTTEYLKNFDKLRRKSVVVGLPEEKVGGEVYGDGNTIASVGASHEYGSGVPRRSFLRSPFKIKQDVINGQIEKQFKEIVEKGKKVETALGLIGAQARNISAKAFVTKGYGEWKELSDSTVEAKGRSQILIDTGTLRNSLTWAIRDD